MLGIRVPATTANMGPGFDCLGVALSIYNEFYFEEIESGFIIEGCPDEFKNENNLMYTSYRKTLDMSGSPYKGIRIVFKSNIPISKGLGSSGSCIIGGIAAANSIADLKLSREDILNIASVIEGHPDNITPAIIGGMTASVAEDSKVYYARINLPDDIKFCAFIPDFMLSTKLSRSVLPKSIPYKDAVFNIGRVSILVAALNLGRTDLIAVGVKDRIHSIYRKRFIEDYDYIIEACVQSGALGVFLSGAGPTIMCITKADDNGFIQRAMKSLKSLNHKWNGVILNPDLKGYSFI